MFDTAPAGIFRPAIAARAPVKFIEDVWPRIFDTPITLCELSYHPGGVRFDEMVFLASIVTHLQPVKIFEIGTCMGRTTINLAKNSDKLKAMYTLNLPPDDSCAVEWLAPDRKLYEYSKDKIGTRWRKYAMEGVIRQLYGDSAYFDYTPYTDMDFVFIDANKQKDYVASDSANGWKMLKAGGVLIWHDYAYCDGVTEAVDAFARQMNIEIVNIYKTTLAVAKK